MPVDSPIPNSIERRSTSDEGLHFADNNKHHDEAKIPPFPNGDNGDEDDHSDDNASSFSLSSVALAEMLESVDKDSDIRRDQNSKRRDDTDEIMVASEEQEMTVTQQDNQRQQRSDQREIPCQRIAMNQQVKNGRDDRTATTALQSRPGAFRVLPSTRRTTLRNYVTISEGSSDTQQQPPVMGDNDFIRNTSQALAMANLVENELVARADEILDNDEQTTIIHPKKTPRRQTNFWTSLTLLALFTLLVTGIIVGAILLLRRGNSSENSSTNPFIAPTGQPIPQPKTSKDWSMSPSSQMPSMSPSFDHSLAPSDEPVYTEERLVNLIRSVALQSGDEFEDANSYQSRAFELLRINPVTPLAGDERNIQRYALACILIATNSTRNKITDAILGQNAILEPWSSFGSENQAPDSGINRWFGIHHECSWLSLDCTNADVPWAITSLSLSQRNLIGKFPPETQLLSHLQVLSMHSNRFLHNAGPENNNWLGQLTALTFLQYHSTSFEYDKGIPSTFAFLSNLRVFELYDTLYTGPIQEGIFPRLTSLTRLDIHGNAFNSTIPNDIHQASKLSSFFAHNASIMGNLSYLEGMQSLRRHSIDNNPDLAGTIPTFFNSLPQLTDLTISGCSISGTIPTEIGQLRSIWNPEPNSHPTWIKELDFSDNQLSGSLPSELGLLQGLQSLRVHGNPRMTGVVPEAVCTIAALEPLTVDCPPVGNVSCSCCTSCGPPLI